jgi:creatinine amidohydrolase
MKLAEATPEEYHAIMQSKPAIIFPIGSMEWHDAHLPFGFDFLKVEKVCELIADRVGCFCAPPFSFGYPRHMARDPVKGIGTFCPEFQPLYEYVLAIGKIFVHKGFRVIYFLSGHYERSQIYMIKLIARHLVDYARDMGKEIIALAHQEPDYTIHEGISQNAREDTQQGNDSTLYRNGDHAGFYETSLGLATIPQYVISDKIGPEYFDPELGKPNVEHGKKWLEMILSKASSEINNALNGKETL